MIGKEKRNIVSNLKWKKSLFELNYYYFIKNQNWMYF